MALDHRLRPEQAAGVHRDRQGRRASGRGCCFDDCCPCSVRNWRPAERRRLPSLPGYDGPILAVCGPEGSIEMPQGVGRELEPPDPVAGRAAHALAGGARPSGGAERRDRGSRRDSTWPNNSPASTVTAPGGSRIWDGWRTITPRWRAAPPWTAATCSPRHGPVKAADSTRWPNRCAPSVPDEALVASTTLRADLDALMLRCRAREDLADGLGASASTRYRPGVRALFTGPSGTGKTLAAGWIATRLGLPLYRVDLASVTSKYIGETEKNLSQLLARAEQAEVILLFDEADSLFGKRTDINDANDRFANAQTNYLLQRIENYDGVVVLTSNSQARFDDGVRAAARLHHRFPGARARRAARPLAIAPWSLARSSPPPSSISSPSSWT